MKKLLDDEYTYKQLPNDPTTKIENKITKALKSIEEKKLISKEQRLKLAPQHSTPPQIYGLPKIQATKTYSLSNQFFNASSSKISSKNHRPCYRKDKLIYTKFNTFYGENK